jgi:hypothetical protein
MLLWGCSMPGVRSAMVAWDFWLSSSVARVRCKSYSCNFGFLYPFCRGRGRGRTSCRALEAVQATYTTWVLTLHLPGWSFLLYTVMIQKAFKYSVPISRRNVLTIFLSLVSELSFLHVQNRIVSTRVGRNKCLLGEMNVPGTCPADNLYSFYSCFCDIAGKETRSIYKVIYILLAIVSRYPLTT